MQLFAFSHSKIASGIPVYFKMYGYYPVLVRSVYFFRKKAKKKPSPESNGHEDK